jgi:magnesium transporter
MLKELLKPEIKELIANRRWDELKKGLSSWPFAEIAELLLDIEKHDRVLLFRALPRDISSDVFSYLEYDERDALLRDMTDQETKELLADLSPDDRTDLLEELPSKATRRMLNLLSPEDLKEARELLGYPEDSIGRSMTPDFVAVRPFWTIDQALEHIRKFGKDSETIYRIYVTDKDGRLMDDILLRNIIIANKDKTIEDLMDHHVVSVSAFEDQEEAVRAMEKYDVFALPVVDSQGQLVGIVTFDDIMDIQSEETTEDFQKISAIAPVDQSYLSASVWRLWGKRYPWLLALLLANFITASVISAYEEILQQVVVLVSFIPLLIGTAGNSGTQSSTLIVRSLATGEVELGSWLRVIAKELLVGIMLGIALGVVAYLVGFIIGGDNISVALVVSFSMISLIIWANLIGAILPMLIEKVNLDPAVISSPLIATLIDVSGIVVYFNIAMMLLDI